MSTTLDYLVKEETPSDRFDLSICLIESEKCASSTSNEESILDLSQRPPAAEQSIFIDNWQRETPMKYSDEIAMDSLEISPPLQQPFDLEQSLTAQVFNETAKELSLSDNPNQSQMDFYASRKKAKSISSKITIREIEPCPVSSPYPLASFLWSKYFALIGERAVSDEYFDHYLASVESALKLEMKLEYCYDLEKNLYWIVQIQLVSHAFIYVHYLGLPENDTAHDFWTSIYDQRCHPMGFCQSNNQTLTPPAALQRILLPEKENSLAFDQQSEDVVPEYLFDKDVGLTPVEQLKIGMILEIQDLHHPWHLWFVRILRNRGGRLHLRYLSDSTLEEEEDLTAHGNDIQIFYLDRRVHPIGWTSRDPSTYSYEIPTSLQLSLEKQAIVDYCLTQSTQQFLPPNLFKEQEEYTKHRFTQGMKLEVFQPVQQNIAIGTIGTIHNDYYFDVCIDDESERRDSFVAHATHPHILPARWASEHKLVLINERGLKQSEEYWNLYTEQHGLINLASERCFNLIRLNSTGSNRAEPGMKMEMIARVQQEDWVFSVTLIHVADHLMWLRVDDTTALHDEHLFYHVLPINSLDVFPVGWAKFNGFPLRTPMQYQINLHTSEQDRSELFSSVTHSPRIPRVYLSEVYLLTIYINIRCYFGPNFCSSRLSRLPSKYGPGPYREVLLDLFHHLLSAISPTAQRALRRLDQQSNAETRSSMKSELVKATRKAGKLIRPISLPTEVRSIEQYLRHVCTQLETCPSLISIRQIHSQCPDRCSRLNNTFAFSSHAKPKRSQVRSTQTRTRKQKSLLCHLQTPLLPSSAPSSIPDDPSSNDTQSTIISTTNHSHDLSETNASALPVSDRQTRGRRVHIDTKTHRVTRTNKRQKGNTEQSTKIEMEQETTDGNNLISSTTAASPIPESKRTRAPKKKRSLSPAPDTTSNILSPGKPSRKRHPLPVSHSLNDLTAPDNYPLPTLDISPPTALLRPTPYPLAPPPPPIDPRNPLTWNVNDVCWYLNESGCSFAIKTIKEQEIDGAALLLLDDLNNVQNLLEFKLGPAVKFCHVVEQLRSQVIDTIHSSPSLKTSSRFSSK